jgi:GAF domain-containing protein
MGEVAITGQSVHTNFIDIGGEQHDPSQLFDKAVDAPEEMHVQTLVSVPLVVADGPVLGVCQFVNKCNKTVFSRADVLTLNAAAALVGMAIVNADLQGQVSQVELRFSSLQDLVRKALTPPRTSHEDKIDHVLTHCRRVLCADVLLLYKSNPRDNTFRNVAMDASLLATGYWSRGYSIDMVQGTAVFGQGIVGLCAISGEMVKTTLECRSDDALDVMDSQGRFDKSIDAPANYPVRSLLCMPIKDPATGTLIGVIEVMQMC